MNVKNQDSKITSFSLGLLRQHYRLYQLGLGIHSKIFPVNLRAITIHQNYSRGK